MSFSPQSWRIIALQRSEPSDARIAVLEHEIDILKKSIGGKKEEGVDIQEHVRCLTTPEGSDTFYNDSAHARSTIEKLPAEELARYVEHGDWHSVSKWIIFDLFQPTYEYNALDLIRYTHRALVPGFNLQSNVLEISESRKCVIFSVGSNGQFDFEQDMHRLFPACTIHTFDCTGSWQDPSTKLHPWCMGGEDKTDDKGRQYKRMSTVSKELGVETISLLKMDIENFEWPFFIDLLNEPVENRPMQILVEFHAGIPVGNVPRPYETAPTMFEGWDRNWAVPMIRMLKLFDKLGREGFVELGLVIRHKLFTELL
ncbi:hypothetical protein SpCBS45565_g05738 [Spizellomyces sp. 'palustris']|nr:hypothetical protein SpCBS45565_g05738 [Spizellomyces sp. 'palustris']